MAPVRAPVNPLVLRWARTQAGYGIDQVAARLKKAPGVIESWEDGSQQPTVNQLRDLSVLYRRTPAFFFLSEPPEDRGTERPPDFRSRKDAQVSPAILREISKAEERRRHYIELSRYPEVSPDYEPPNPLPDIGPDLRRHTDKVARRARALVDVSIDEQFRFESDGQGLRTWIVALERIGVLVFQMSRVPLEEGRGLSLYREQHPMILLNGADDQGARIFTLFHEFAHLLSHSSGLCDVFNDSEVEQYCNRFAASFLLPEVEFLNALGRRPSIEAIPDLASRFLVSQSAVAIRMRNFGLISQADVDGHLAEARRIWLEAKERQRARKKKGGPPHHKTHLRNLGENYVSTVLRAMDAEAISPVDAAYFLEAKLSTVEQMRSDLLAGEIAS